MAYFFAILLLILPLIDAAEVASSSVKPNSKPSFVRVNNRNNQKQHHASRSQSQVKKENAEMTTPFPVREIFKFELSDARIPDKRNPKELMEPDMAAMGSRIIQITHPIAAQESRTRVVKELPFSVQKAISHAIKHNYNLPHLDTVKYYLKEQAKPQFTYSIAESSNAALSTTKLLPENGSKPWWSAAPAEKSSHSASYAVISNEQPSSTTPRPYSILKSYPGRYIYKLTPTSSGVIPFYGDKLQPKSPFVYSRPLTPQNTILKQVDPPNFLENVPEVTQTIDTLSSTAPVLFPATPSPFPKQKNPLYSLLKFYSSQDDIKNYFNSKDTITLIKAAVAAIREQNPHLEVIPKGIENNELIVRVTPKPDYFVTQSSGKQFPVDPNLVYLKKPVTEPNLTYLTRPQPNGDVNVVRIVPAALQEEPEKSHAYVNNLHSGQDPNSEYASGYAFGYQVRDHHTGNNFRHTQNQSKDGTTRGEYKILMPDGRTQNVRYKADEQGYHADVSYDI